MIETIVALVIGSLIAAFQLRAYSIALRAVIEGVEEMGNSFKPIALTTGITPEQFDAIMIKLKETIESRARSFNIEIFLHTIVKRYT